ncbi:hypothetical protein JW906_03405 [bacterium]|nr:hypothetical protein [bacterium]
MIWRVRRKRRAACFFFVLKNITACSLILSHSSACLGAGEELPLSAASAGLASALCAFPGLPESLAQNPSGPAFLEQAEIQFSTASLFRLKECALKSFTAGLPFRWGAWGCMAQSLGGALYRENSLSVCLAVRNGERTAFGVSARILAAQAAGYGVRASACMDLGWTVRISEKWFWAAGISNCTRSQMGGERLPQCGRTGISFRPCSGIRVLAELDKDIRQAPESRWGIETRLAQGLALRCGFGTRPDVFCLGIGAGLRRLRMDYAVSEHPVLGATHHITVRLIRRHEKNKTENNRRP